MSGNTWISDLWKSEPIYPWGFVVFDTEDIVERKFQLSVDVYNRNEDGTSGTKVTTVDMYFNYTKESDGYYVVPQTDTEVVISPMNEQLLPYFIKSANGKYNLNFRFKFKSILDGAIHIDSMMSFGYDNWIAWPSTTSAENAPHIRWSYSDDSLDDFTIKAFTNLKTEEGKKPDIYIQNEDVAYNIFDVSVETYTTVGGYNIIFHCKYTDENTFIGRKAKNGKYIDSTTKCTVKVIQPVSIGGKSFEVVDSRDFYFRPIVYHYDFTSRSFVVEPKVGETVNITFRHEEQTADNISTPITDTNRQLTKNDFKITVKDSGASSSTYLEKGDVTYNGIIVTLPVTVIAKPEDTMEFNVQVNNARLSEEAELDELPTAELDAIAMIAKCRVDWWDGANYKSAGNNFENALISPVPYNISEGIGDSVGIYIKFKDEHGLNLNSANVHFDDSYSSDYNNCFELNLKHNVSLDGIVYDLRISIQTKLVVSYYNDGIEPRIFYTGQPIEFDLDINYVTGGVYTYPMSIKLGPVISISHDVAKGRFADYPGYPTGEYFDARLKAEVGQKIVTQSRAHEWFLDNSNVNMTGNHIVGLQNASDRTVRGRRYDIVWKYNGTELSENTGAPETVPQAELLSGESPYVFTREFKNAYLKVQHAASWTDYENRPQGRYYNDGGAWRVEVTNMDAQFASGNLTALVTITDVNPEIPMHHWYDGGKTTILPVANEISLIKWTVYNMGSYPPLIENSDLLYTMTTDTQDALTLYLRVQDTDASVSVNSKLQNNEFMDITHIENVSGETWNKVVHMINKAKFFDRNTTLTNASDRVVSNEEITFTITYTSSTVTTSINHTMHIGPVVDKIEIIDQKSEEFFPDYQGTEIIYLIRVPEWKNTSNYQYYTIGNQTFNIDVVEELKGLWYDENEYSISNYFSSIGPDEYGTYTKTRNSTTMPESMRLDIKARHQIDNVCYPFSSNSFSVEVVGYLNFYSNEVGLLNKTKWFLCTSYRMFTSQNVSQYYTFDLEFINNYHFASFLVLYDGSDAYIRRIRSDGSFDQGNISIIAGYIDPEDAYYGDEPSGFAFSWSNEFAYCSGSEWATGTSTVITKYEVTQDTPVPGQPDKFVNQYQTHFSQSASVDSKSSISWCLNGEPQNMPSSSSLDKYPFFDSRHPIWH